MSRNQSLALKVFLLFTFSSVGAAAQANNRVSAPEAQGARTAFDVAELHAPAAAVDFSSSASAPAESTVGASKRLAAAGGAQADSAVSTRPFSALGVGVKVELGGIGFDLATPLGRKVNLRGGGSFFGYSTTIVDSGINYDGKLQLRSGHAAIDWFPFGGGFRLSGGVEVYNGNQISATATVPAQRSFTINSTTYYSSAADPLNGSVSLLLGKKAGPTFSLGWGNLVPRKAGRHISVPFEIGAVYVGSPTLTYSFGGSVCDVNGNNCQKVATNTAFQQNLAAQKNTYQNDINVLRFYPIFSIGLGYKF